MSDEINPASDEALTADSLRDGWNLLSLLVEMVESQTGQPASITDCWHAEAPAIAKKFIYHIHSAYQLLEGSMLSVDGHEHRFVSHGSICVLARAAMETFVTFGFIYGHPDREVGHFRYLTWRQSGLQDRQGFVAGGAWAAEIKVREAKEIDQLLAAIKAHPCFTQLSKEEAGKITGKKREWRTAGWDALAAECGIHKHYFAETYNYLCSYSHASFLAVLQITTVRLSERGRAESRVLARLSG